MMIGYCPLLLLLLLTSATAAPSGDLESYQMIIPQKRAALVLDRLLVALQKALREETMPERPADGPRTAPLRVASVDGDMIGGGRKEWAPWREQGPPAPAYESPLQGALEDEMRALQRRGQAGAARGRVVLRCYFNAITCF